MDDESELIRAVLAGRTDRFRGLVERHERPVRRFVLQLVGDAHQAQDIAQDVFVAAFEKLGSFDAQRGRFSTWLYTIARNRCSNWLRRRRATRDEELDAVADPLVRDADLRADLDRALASLPEPQRAAFLLAEMEELSMVEVARIEGVPVGTVKSRVHRARERLQGLLRHVREDT